MTIKTECVIKHLKHDYKTLACAVGIFVVAAAVALFLWYGLPPAVSLMVSIIAPYWSAYNLLNLFAGIIVLLFTVGVAVFFDKESLTVSTFDDNGRKTGKEPSDSVVMILFVLIIGGLLYGMYHLAAFGAVYGGAPPYESELLSACIFIILILIGTPIGCAIARCKE